MMAERDILHPTVFDLQGMGWSYIDRNKAWISPDGSQTLTGVHTGGRVYEVGQWVLPRLKTGSLPPLRPSGHAVTNPDGTRDFIFDRDFSCPCCPKVLSSRKGREKHYRIHVGDRRFVCECGTRFVENYQLAAHRKRCPDAHSPMLSALTLEARVPATGPPHSDHFAPITMSSQLRDLILGPR